MLVFWMTKKRNQLNACVLANFFSTVEITTRENFRTSVFLREIFRISLVVELGLYSTPGNSPCFGDQLDDHPR
jgi:hypothetical protein